MGLQSEIKDAFIKASGAEKYSGGDTGNVDKLADSITTAIIEFLKKQTWTITEMTSVLEVEKLETITNLSADILPKVKHLSYVGTPAAPGPSISVSGRKKGVMIPPLKLRRHSGGQGGQLISIGHAYVGKPAQRVKGGGKHAVEWNNFTKVRLNPNTIKGR